MDAEARRRALLERIPDDARHNELRGLVRRPSTLLVSGRDRASGFALAPLHELAVAFGMPGDADLDELEDVARAARVDPSRVEVHAPLTVLEPLVHAGRLRPGERLRVMAWREDASAALEGLAESHPTRVLEPDDEALDTLPRAVQAELTRPEEWPANAASFAGGAVAGLAHSFAETETLWDVAVGTVPAFRRQGFATAASAALVLRQLERDLRPVWMTAESNGASRALAVRLGFEQIDVVASATLTGER
ncbi:MAG: GNAT family N-acetyltransferase [Planctomycetota bacterium]